MGEARLEAWTVSWPVAREGAQEEAFDQAWALLEILVEADSVGPPMQAAKECLRVASVAEEASLVSEGFSAEPPVP